MEVRNLSLDYHIHIYTYIYIYIRSPEVTLAPEKLPSQKEIHLPTIIFQGLRQTYLQA